MSTMVRINAAIRDETIKNLLNKKFLEQDLAIEKKRKEFKAEEDKLRHMAYEAVFSKKLIEKMEAMPAGWMPDATGVTVRVMDPKDENNFTDEVVSWRDDTQDNNGVRRIPFKFYHSHAFAAVIPSDHPYIVEKRRIRSVEQDLQEEEKKLREEKRSARAKVERVISSVTTVKRLLEIWPAVQEFLPEMVSGDGGGVPALIIEDLNKEFGL